MPRVSSILHPILSTVATARSGHSIGVRAPRQSQLVVQCHDVRPQVVLWKHSVFIEEVSKPVFSQMHFLETFLSEREGSGDQQVWQATAPSVWSLFSVADPLSNRVEGVGTCVYTRLGRLGGGSQVFDC